MYDRASKLTKLEYDPVKVYEDLIMVTKKENHIYQEILEKIEVREQAFDQVHFFFSKRNTYDKLSHSSYPRRFRPV